MLAPTRPSPNRGKVGLVVLRPSTRLTPCVGVEAARCGSLRPDPLARLRGHLQEPGVTHLHRARHRRRELPRPPARRRSVPLPLARRVHPSEAVSGRRVRAAAGRANAGDKLLTLVASALAGGDCIDDADAMRSGGAGRVLGCTVKAPSTIGTFLRSFRWGHVRQLDRLSRELLARGWARASQSRCAGKRAGAQLILRGRIDAIANDVVEAIAGSGHVARDPGNLPGTVSNPDDDRATAAVLRTRQRPLRCGRPAGPPSWSVPFRLARVS